MGNTMRTLTLLWAVVASLVFVTPAFAANGNTSLDSVTYRPDVTFTLRTNIANGKLVYVGDTGEIEGQINPDLRVPENAVVQINVINGDGAIHDIAVPEFVVMYDEFTGRGCSTAIVFFAFTRGNLD